MMITIIVPLLIGIGIGWLNPNLASQLARVASKAGTIVLALGLVLILARSLPGVIAVVWSPAMIAIMAMSLFGLAAGHVLGGPEIGNRRSLAIATSSRHPGVALGLALAADLAEREPVVAVILMHLLISTLLSLPYARWAQQKA